MSILTDINREILEIVRTLDDAVRPVEKRQIDTIRCIVHIYAALVKIENNIQSGSKESIEGELSKIFQNIEAFMFKDDNSDAK